MRHIKFGLLAGTALSLSWAQNASAADMPARAPVYKAAPAVAKVYNWTGFYVGGNVGYSWGKADSDVAVGSFVATVDAETITFPGGAFSESLKPKGVIGGGQIGYNWQANNWVYSLETDFQASGQKNSRQRTDSLIRFDCTIVTECDFFSTTDITAKLSWFGTLRGRIGQDWNGWLFYATGGLAYGRIKVSGANTLLVAVGARAIDAAFTTPFSFSKTTAGWTGGGGVESATWMNNWTWKVEYLYIDLGSFSANVAGTPGLSVQTTRFTDHIVRFGLNYRFGAPGKSPVVARY